MTKHGTKSCYVAGCRRPECVKANTDYQAEYRRRVRAGELPKTPTMEYIKAEAKRLPNGTAARFLRMTKSSELEQA